MTLTLLVPVLVFAMIVLVHEGGHFLFAKLTGMRVEEFSIGFGLKLGSFRKGETIYSLRIIPLGGFNRISGMESKDTDDPKAFSNRPIWAKLLVISAGSLFNMLLAFFIFIGIYLYAGYQTFPNLPVVGEVIEGTSAANKGIQKGDKIISVNGITINTWTDIGNAVDKQDKRVIPVTIEHEGQIKKLDILLTESQSERPIIGISPYLIHHDANFIESVTLSAKHCVELVKMMAVGLLESFNGHEAEIAGPIGVARMSTQVAGLGLIPLLAFIALLSMNLGFLNLLPVPLLDGGVLVLTILEGISGHKMPEKTLYYIQIAGVTILLTLFFFAMFNDISDLLK